MAKRLDNREWARKPKEQAKAKSWQDMCKAAEAAAAEQRKADRAKSMQSAMRAAK